MWGGSGFRAVSSCFVTAVASVVGFCLYYNDFPISEFFALSPVEWVLILSRYFSAKKGSSVQSFQNHIWECLLNLRGNWTGQAFLYQRTVCYCSITILNSAGASRGEPNIGFLCFPLKSFFIFSHFKKQLLPFFLLSLLLPLLFLLSLLNGLRFVAKQSKCTGTSCVRLSWLCIGILTIHRQQLL